ncbi:MAG: nucleotidyl transferase AbiEii/AbiGii toxin family protein [Armatimonadetes bacterium]|nr:nucleotidyl transferase AbiEii/AbiGii toxin family protein [Akkermansiaceae bacterium]
MNPADPSNIATWVEESPPGQREFREAVHIILSAITNDPGLRNSMVMKGGILMGIRYRSPRFTKDIDFSTTLSLKELDPGKIHRTLDVNLALVATDLEYDLDCKVQGCKVNPSNRPDASFPSIELTIGHAYKGTPKHRRLLQGQSPSVVSIDFSMNERILEVENLEIGKGESLRAYAFVDMLAEKFRSLLQQVVRNRFRRQDVFDLAMLIERRVGENEKTLVLKSLIEKALSRDMKIGRDSLDDSEVKRRAKADYHTLADEIEGELPDFEMTYEKITTFYRSLPWSDVV